MKTIVRESRNIVKALGTFRRYVNTAEEEKKLKFRRSLVINRDLKEGHRINAEDILFKRPGTGIRPDEVQYAIGRKLKHDKSLDDVLHWDDII